jgi:hypothetical protein
MTADPEAASREWTEAVLRNQLALETNRVANELERLAGHARAKLDDRRMSHASMLGMKARLLAQLRAVGAVALDYEEG